MKTSCCNRWCCLKAGLVVGGILVVIGGVLMVAYNALFESIIKTQTSVIPDTLAYRLVWKDVQVPIYRSFYLFNVTNKQEFLAQTPDKYVKPVLQEIGPYAYREFLVKENVTYLPYNASHPEEVRFTQTAKFYFDPARSNGSESDVITTLNFLVPLIGGVLEQIFGPGPILNTAFATLNQIIRATDTELLFTKTVGEYLFGFEDPFLSAILDLLFPDREDQKFGLFLLTNMSAGWPEYQVYTGRGNHLLNNVITRFNGKSNLGCWFNESCNELNGTDGTFTPPFMKKDDPVYIFIDEMRRSVFARYERDSTVRGLNTWRFTVPGSIFQSPINNADNQCFCNDPDLMFCRHDGALLVSSCLFNAPLVVSFPHFLYGDGFYLSKLEGLAPEKEKHEIAIDYEPTAGLVLNTSSRIQLGLHMFPHPQIKLLQQIGEEFVFPLIWLNEQAEIPEDIAVKLVGLLYGTFDLFTLLQIILCVVGSIPFLVAAMCCIQVRCRSSYNIDTTKKSAQNKTTKDNYAFDDVTIYDDSKPTGKSSSRQERHLSKL